MLGQGIAASGLGVPVQATGCDGEGLPLCRLTNTQPKMPACSTASLAACVSLGHGFWLGLQLLHGSAAAGRSSTG